MRKKILIIFLVCFCVISFSLALARVTDSQVELYEKAKKVYYENDYDQAISLFTQLIEKQGNTGYLNYNLGNAYFKKGELGLARMQFEKARHIIPRYADLKINLDLLQTRLVDKTENSFSDYVTQTFYFWSSWLTLAEFGWFVFAVTIVFWGLCLQSFLKRRKIFNTSRIILALMFCYLLFGFYLKYDFEAEGHYGIILPQEVNVTASYLEKDETLFQLHEGTRVRIIEHMDFDSDQHWLRVALPQGQKGWVQAEGVGVI